MRNSVPGARYLVLHELPSHHIECLGGREPSNTLTVAGKVSLHDFGSASAGKSVEHQTDRLFRAAACRSGNSGNANAERRSAAFTDSLGECNCDFPAYRSMLLDQLRRNARKFGLQFI